MMVTDFPLKFNVSYWRRGGKRESEIIPPGNKARGGAFGTSRKNKDQDESDTTE